MATNLIFVVFISFILLCNPNTFNSCSQSSTCTCNTGEPCTFDCSGSMLYIYIKHKMYSIVIINTKLAEDCKDANLRGGSATSVTILCTGIK